MCADATCFWGSFHRYGRDPGWPGVKMIVRKVHTKSLRILLFLLFLCRSSALGDDDDDDDDNDGGEPLKKMSLKDYRALVAPNNDDYFYANNYRTDCDLFHCKTGAGFHRREKGEISTDPPAGGSAWMTCPPALSRTRRTQARSTTAD